MDQDQRLEAKKAWEKALAIREQLVKDYPHMIHMQSDLGNINQDLGYWHRKNRDFRTALSYYEKAREVWERLRQIDPEASVHKSDWVNCHLQLAFIHTSLGEFDREKEILEQAQAVQEKLVKEHPADGGYQSDLGEIHYRLGLHWKRAKEYPKAIALIQKAIAYQKTALEKSPRLIAFRNRLSDCYRTLVQLLVTIGENEKGLARVNDRFALWTHDPNQLFFLAKDVAQVPHVVPLNAEQTEVWNDLAMNVLHQAVMAGFQNAEQIRTELFFIKLRNREDFQALVKKLSR